MKITLIGTLPPIKGISEYCIELANSLSKEMKIDFINFKSIYPNFAYPGGTKEYDKEFRIQPNKNLEIRNILAWYNPFSWIKAGLTLKGQVVHINWWTYYLFPVFFTILLLCKIRGKKVIFTVHNVVSHESGKIDITCSAIIYKLADHLIVHSDQNKKTLIRKFGINKNKISEIPYGPLTFYNKKKITKSEARRYFKLQKNQKVILYFGTIRKYKGLDILLKAFRLVLDEKPNTILIVAGENWINWDPYRKLINKLKLNKNIILNLNYVPTSKIKYYFTAADLVVLPYTSFDSQSGVGNLALAFNKAIIVSNVGGIPKLVNDKKRVFNGSINDLVTKIINFIKESNLKKKREEKNFNQSWKEIALKTIKLYKDL